MAVTCTCSVVIIYWSLVKNVMVTLENIRVRAYIMTNRKKIYFNSFVIIINLSIAISTLIICIEFSVQ